MDQIKLLITILGKNTELGSTADQKSVANYAYKQLSRKAWYELGRIEMNQRKYLEKNESVKNKILYMTDWTSISNLK